MVVLFPFPIVEPWTCQFWPARDGGMLVEDFWERFPHFAKKKKRRHKERSHLLPLEVFRYEYSAQP